MKIVNGDDIEKIVNGEFDGEDIRIMPASISLDEIPKLYEALKNNPNIKSVCTNIFQVGYMDFWNKYLRCFVDENGELCMDPSKFTLEIDFEDISVLDDKLLRNIENIEVTQKLDDDKHMQELKMKFPNLKKLDIIGKTEEITFENIFNKASNTSFYKLPYVDELHTRKLLSEESPSESFCIADDCSCIINLDKISEEALPEDEKISVNVRDLDRIGIENLVGKEINLIINNAGELSCEMIEEYQRKGISLQNVKIVGEDYSVAAIKPYSVKDYMEIRQKLEELVEGIDLNLPEKERFAKVYERVGKNIIYDVPAGYPKTDKEKEYEKEQFIDCRNLKNGLLKGKCVCSGYAEILRNALRMVGIEARSVRGDVIDREIKPKDIHKYKDYEIYRSEDGRIFVKEGHEWDKVKLDGKWYNVDITYDANKVRQGASPKYCLKTDKEIKEKDKKVNFSGPECNTEVSAKEIDELFGNKHLYVGNRKIPNMRDFIALTKEVGLAYIEIGTNIVKSVIVLKDKIKKIYNKNKTPLLNSGDNKNSEAKSKSTTTSSWDLKNWGLNREEFEKTQESVKPKSTDQPVKNEKDGEDMTK